MRRAVKGEAASKRGVGGGWGRQRFGCSPLLCYLIPTGSHNKILRWQQWGLFPIDEGNTCWGKRKSWKCQPTPQTFLNNMFTYHFVYTRMNISKASNSYNLGTHLTLNSPQSTFVSKRMIREGRRRDDWGRRSKCEKRERKG